MNFSNRDAKRNPDGGCSNGKEGTGVGDIVSHIDCGCAGVKASDYGSLLRR